MTDRPLIFTGFAGVTLHNGTSQRQVAPYELSGDQAVTRFFRLSNGALFDADGTADGGKTYGNVRFVLRVTGATHAAANAVMLAVTAVLNKRSTLTGVEYGASSSTTRTCNARCFVARPIPREELPMAMGRQYQIDIEMVFQRFTAFS